MKIFFGLFFLVTYNLCFCQLPQQMEWNKLYKGKIDSIVVINQWGYTKETSLNLPNLPEEQIFEKREKGNLKKGRQLLKALQQKKSYEEGFPLLNDTNDKFFFYKNGVQELAVFFSPSTKGLIIYRKEDLIFAGKATHYLQKKISKVIGYNLKKDDILNE